MTPDSLSAVEAAGWPALVIDRAGLIQHANAAAAKVFGSLLEPAPVSLTRLWHPQNPVSPQVWLAQWDPSAALLRALKLRGPENQTLQFSAAICPAETAETASYLMQLLPDSGMALAPGPTDASLLHKQKLDCALQLARTIALDFNNSLTTILGHASWMLSEAGPGNPWRSSLLAVEQAAARAADIANDLGTFSRQDKARGEQAAGDLNRLVQRTVDAFKQKTVPAGIRWTLQPEKRMFAVRFEEAKLQQALTKVLENALEAVGESGQISVQTRNLELEQPTQDRTVQLAPGAYVCIEISDSGPGIEPEVLPRVFEPFFTTKAETGHRGLGLALAYGIVTNHGGGIAVASQTGTGASVRIYLPAESGVIHEHLDDDEDLRGGETVLLVDDEELLLAMGQAVLEAHGYKVLTASGGQEALDLISNTRELVDLMVTDLVMPGITGRELIEHVGVFSPLTRVVLTSGYVWPGGPEFEGLYLQKPFTSRELLRKVRQALAAT